MKKGTTASEATKRKMSESHKKRSPQREADRRKKISERGVSETTKAKMREARRTRSPEVDRRIRESLKRFYAENSPRAIAAKKKISEAAKGCHRGKGRSISDETRMRMSEAQKRRPPRSPETHQKQRESINHYYAAIGRSHTEERKNHVPRPQTGWHHSEETKQQMSIDRKGKCHAVAESNKLRIGPKHPNWRNGSSFKPHNPDFNRKLKLQIRQRANFHCQLCGIKETKPSLCVHHIDYDKQNSGPSNLIAVCASCHGKTNRLRKLWKRSLRKHSASLSLQLRA